jgi:hypothetical protein
LHRSWCELLGSDVRGQLLALKLVQDWGERIGGGDAYPMK